MNFDIDTIIFVVFMTITLVVGFTSSRGIKTIKSFAIGDGDFTTPTIAATIVATWLCGSTFFSTIVETYKQGLNYVWLIFASDFLALFLIAKIFAPRMQEFLGNLSVAEAMGSLYGNNIRIFTSIAGFGATCGIIAIQLKIAGMLFEHIFDIDYVLGVFIAGTIVILYSVFGGIKSVTFTDVIQFVTFAVALPTLLYFLIKNFDSYSLIIEQLSLSRNFHYGYVFNFSNKQFVENIGIFFIFLIPAFNPAMFQRVAMARDIKQVVNSFTYASIISVFFVLLISSIGIITFASNDAVEENKILEFIMYSSELVGLRGIIMVGVMSMVMSTIDSYINSSAVLMTHDFFNPLKLFKVNDNNELKYARAVSLIIGIISMFLSFYKDSPLGLFILALSFYMPVVTVPFIMTLFGFRSSGKSVFCAMVSGISVVIIWEVFSIDVLNSTLVGMTSNLVTLFSVHYLGKQEGGWVGIKDPKPLIQLRAERRYKMHKLIKDIKNFNLFKICLYNKPSTDGIIALCGFFLMMSTFGAVQLLPKNIAIAHADLLDWLYPAMFFVSSTLMGYPLWLKPWKESGFIGIYWNLIFLICGVIFTVFMALLSGFSGCSVMVCMVNFMLFSTFVRWQWALTVITLGSFIAYNIFAVKYSDVVLASDYTSVQFNITYFLILFSSILLIFLRPKQKQTLLTEERNLYLNDKISEQRYEVAKATEIKNEFLRNVPHESHTPLTTIIGFGEELYRKYDTLTEDERKEYAKLVYDGSKTLHSLVDNVFDLSKLSTDTYQIFQKDTNLTDIIYSEIDRCKRLYIEIFEEDKRTWETDVDDNVIVNCDKYFISKTVHNLIANAIKYCQEGKILISLKTERDMFIKFTISDEGVGIPKKEMLSIFEPFVTSSRTKTPSEGRGIGLTLAKKVIDLHEGIIKVANNSTKGSIFTFTLPL